jgi:hypothetical protein
MAKETTELVTARAALRKAERDLGDPGALLHLREAIDSLLGMMSGNSPQIEKDLARKLVLTYRNKVLSEVKAILANFDSYESESLDHWNKVMEVFVDAGVGDPEFNGCREHLVVKCCSRSIDSLKPGDLDGVETELREVLNSLAAHRSSLSNIKLGIRK